MAPAGGLAVGVAACPQVAMAGYTATGLLAVRAVVTCSDGSSQEIPRPRELEGVSVLASVSGAVQSVINQAISFLSISARFGCNPMGMLSGRPTCESKNQCEELCTKHLSKALDQQTCLSACEFVFAQLGGRPPS